MAGQLTTLQYIKQQTSLPDESATDFMRMWGQLTQKDKEEMKAWAEEEM